MSTFLTSLKPTGIMQYALSMSDNVLPKFLLSYCMQQKDGPFLLVYRVLLCQVPIYLSIAGEHLGCFYF